MGDIPQQQPGWYYGQGDPPGTERYWDGSQWIGEPRTVVPGGFGPAPDSNAVLLASPQSRIGGRLLDGLVWTVLGVIGAIPLFPYFIETFRGAFDAIDAGQDPPEVELPSFGLRLLSSVIGLVLVCGYEIYMNVNMRGTLGKRAIGAVVQKEDGSPLDMQAGLQRMVPYIVVTLIPVFIPTIGQWPFWLVAIIGLIMLFTNSRHQTPWDKAGGTIVAKS